MVDYLVKLISNFVIFATAIKIIHSQVPSVNLQCTYYNGLWAYQTETYNFYCSPKNIEIFSEDRVFIESVDGQSSDNRVTGFHLFAPPNLKFIPLNLENTFQNLTGLSISVSQLSQITQNDFKVLPQLKYLWLPHNQIKYLRGDIFAFNFKLEVIVMFGNQISHIDPTTFNSLSKLRVLNMASNDCKSLTKSETRSSVETQMRKIQNGECTTDQNNGDVLLTQKTTTTMSTTNTMSEDPTTTEIFMTTTDEFSLENQMEELRRENDELKQRINELINENKECKVKIEIIPELNKKIANLTSENEKKSLKLQKLDEKVKNCEDFRNIFGFVEAKLKSFSEKIDSSFNSLSLKFETVIMKVLEMQSEERNESNFKFQMTNMKLNEIHELIEKLTNERNCNENNENSTEEKSSE